ncbi:MAG: OmpA family protein [Alphaproteobacteria bacterium]|nr:MAG: OmpA family protein [Alphaproteobacteria bacterium]
MRRALVAGALTVATAFAAAAQPPGVFYYLPPEQGGVAPGAQGPLIDLRNPERAPTAEKYVPTIWVDPDGCYHWVMDDGAEGYMDAVLDRDGKPVCKRVPACRIEPADTLFATDSYRITPAARKRLEHFFRNAGATAYIIEGHTDSRASDAYNLRLSLNRAKAVAEVAASVGARVAAVRGFGEREPRASNRTARGRALNRRVEIFCIR